MRAAAEGSKAAEGKPSLVLSSAVQKTAVLPTLAQPAGSSHCAAMHTTPWRISPHATGNMSRGGARAGAGRPSALQQAAGARGQLDMRRAFQNQRASVATPVELAAKRDAIDSELTDLRNTRDAAIAAVRAKEEVLHETMAGIMQHQRRQRERQRLVQQHRQEHPQNHAGGEEGQEGGEEEEDEEKAPGVVRELPPDAGAAD